jgi:hypothetical protein
MVAMLVCFYGLSATLAARFQHINPLSRVGPRCEMRNVYFPCANYSQILDII